MGCIPIWDGEEAMLTKNSKKKGRRNKRLEEKGRKQEKGSEKRKRGNHRFPI